jgi:hypothetical protein
MQSLATYQFGDLGVLGGSISSNPSERIASTI